MDAYFYNLFLHLTTTYPALVKVFLTITFFGSYRFVLFFILTAFIFILYLSRNRGLVFFKKNFLSLFASIAITASVVTILKNIFARVGPETRVLYETDFSFPSAHAAVAVALFGITFFLVNKNCRLSHFWKNIFFTFTIIFIFLIAFSRLVLGVHYLSDVVAGVFLGYLGYLLGTFMYKKLCIKK
jgi:membrane-associated phospholipid phosphatase